MAQITWDAMNPIDTSRYLDAIQKLADEHYGGDLQAYYKSFEEDFS